MNRRSTIVCFLSFLLLSAAAAEASDRSLPVDMDRVKATIASYDPNLSVSEDTAWRDDQTVYSLADGDGNTIAYLSSAGEGAEGMLYFLLMHADESASEFYKDDYSAVMKAAAELYDDALDADQLYDDFINAYNDQSEDEFRWTGTYQDTKIEIEKNVSGYVDLSIALYNSEKYSPILEEGNADDYAAPNPAIRISEISYEQYSEAAGSKEGSADEEPAENPDYKFYKIEICDDDYHTEYKIDVELFLKFDLSKENETAKYEYVKQNNPSDEYDFSDISGYCRREGDNAEAALVIPVVERSAGGEVQYKEKFQYQISYLFSVDDLENIDIHAEN